MSRLIRIYVENGPSRRFVCFHLVVLANYMRDLLNNIGSASKSHSAVTVNNDTRLAFHRIAN